MLIDFLKRGTVCGTPAYWGVVLSIFPAILLITLGVRYYLVSRHRALVRAGYTFIRGDIQWTEKNTIKYPLICSTSGLVAGMFGVGGGIVKVLFLANACLAWPGLLPAQSSLLERLK